MPIKHLVLPGGGVNGLKTLGILATLAEKNVFKIKDIESIYATSIGSLIAILIALKFEWSAIIDYMIKRPWHEAFCVDIFGIFENKGLVTDKMFHIFFKPFFDASGIPLDITFQKFYDITHTELHFYSLNLHTFKMTDLCHITHPDLPLLKAVQMTAAIPILIAPVFYNSHFYIDGAVGGTNYPLNYCDKPHDEILGIYNDYVAYKTKHDDIDESTVFFSYFAFLCHRLLDNLLINKQYIIDHSIPKLEIVCEASQMSIQDCYEAIQSAQKRHELFEFGVKTANTFLEKQQKII